MEFVNTLTNLGYRDSPPTLFISSIFSLTHLAVFYAYQGVRKSRQYADFWPRTIPYLALACVGFGSAAFHGTMKLEAQWCKQPSTPRKYSIPYSSMKLNVILALGADLHLLADDLSMTLATGVILYRVASFGKPPQEGTNSRTLSPCFSPRSRSITAWSLKPWSIRAASSQWSS